MDFSIEKLICKLIYDFWEFEMDWMPEAKRRQAKAMFEKGLGYKAVARLLELNVYTVRDWGREFKAGKFRVSDTELGDAATVVDLREDQILELRRQGFDDRTIALRIGLSLQTVRRYLRRSLMKDLSGTGNGTVR